MMSNTYNYLNELLIPYSETTNELNPITFNNTCTLINTKKIDYYKHTFDPSREFEILRQLQSQLNFPDEVFDRFNNVPKEGCCNVISITLYFEQCRINNRFKTFINSINRTVKNVRKNLPDWIVRLYLDKSVYDCFTNLDYDAKNNDTISKEFRDNLISYIKMFDMIVSSPNVELYTFICDNSDINIARTRIHRFLPMIDPNINLYIIREADGYVSNLDCHNIKVYANSNRLFYLAPFETFHTRISIDGIINKGSYSPWLGIYKLLFDNEYFETHQNIYDLLAGIFACKLKLKQKYYSSSIESLNTKFNSFLLLSEEDFLKKYQLKKNDYISFFNVGFDEILLLKLFKDIISIQVDNIEVDNNKIRDPSIIDNINFIRDTIFFSDNIKKFSFNLKIEYDDSYKGIKSKAIIKPADAMDLLLQIVVRLKIDKILKLEFKLGGFNLDGNTTIDGIVIIIDGLLLSNIREDCNRMFNISYNWDKYTTFASELLNISYNGNYDKYYDSQIGGYKEKYLKYKNKYLQLKNKF